MAERGEVEVGFVRAEGGDWEAISSLVCYTAFKRMSPQGISVGVSGVILLIMRCWEGNARVIKSCLKRYSSINITTMNSILMTFHSKLE